AQWLPADDELVAKARDGVEQLNARHGAGRFFLFHRERRWNAAERRWMGWERKRGKLVEFNRVLRGAADTSCTVRHGDLAALPSRQDREVRGDGQIARWIWHTVPDAHDRVVRNVVPAPARWKIFDNLRRSLLAPSLVILLVAGWTVLPGGPLPWSGLTLLILGFPILAQLGRSMFSRVQ